MTREQVLEAEIERADREIESLTANRRKLQDELLALRSPFQTGDLIEWDAGSQVWRGKVEAILGTDRDRPPWRWTVRRQRKDGTLGASTEVRVYSNPRLIDRGGDS